MSVRKHQAPTTDAGDQSGSLIGLFGSAALWFSSEEVITPADGGICPNTTASHWLMCFPSGLDWAKLHRSRAWAAKVIMFTCLASHPSELDLIGVEEHHKTPLFSIDLFIFPLILSYGSLIYWVVCKTFRSCLFKIHPCLFKVKSARRGGREKAGIGERKKTRSKHLQHLLQPSWVSLGNWRRQSGEVTVSSEWRRWGAAASYLPQTAVLHHFLIFTLVLSSMRWSTKFSSQIKINRGRERKTIKWVLILGSNHQKLIRQRAQQRKTLQCSAVAMMHLLLQLFALCNK